MTMKFGVLPEANTNKDSSNEIITKLEILSKNGMLQRFQEIYGKPSLDGLGDCHEVTTALMADLIREGQSKGWSYVLGVCDVKYGRIEHSWLEYEGWIVDVSNGWSRPIMIVEQDAYFNMTSVVRSRSRTPKEFRKWIFKKARRAA